MKHYYNTFVVYKMLNNNTDSNPDNKFGQMRRSISDVTKDLKRWAPIQ